MTDNRNWREQAKCAGVEPELFYATTPRGIKAATGICKGCPSIEPCLDAAYEANDKWAVLGGMSPRQRAKTRAAWRRKKGQAARLDKRVREERTARKESA